MQQEFANVQLAVQVVDMTIFGPDHAKKNIKGRVCLSDGVSKIICMVPDKVYNAMVSFNLLKKLKMRKKCIVIDFDSFNFLGGTRTRFPKV